MAKSPIELSVNARDKLLSILTEARKLLALPGNDYSWSSWQGPDDALAELDALIAAVHRGEIPKLTLKVMFAPTGPMQEVSLSSGWAQGFLDLSSRFDAALQELIGAEQC